jgi:CRISPR/Cas system-associated endonuclease Cas1
MGAMTLLVDRRGAEVSVSNNTKAICVRYPDGEVHRVGAFALARIIIHGDAQLSAAVLRVCEEAQV